jgi:hypothetical protein
MIAWFRGFISVYGILSRLEGHSFKRRFQSKYFGSSWLDRDRGKALWYGQLIGHACAFILLK